MGSIGRYIFRATSGAFLVVLISITLLMWLTQALRNFDLMTNQGQSILVFVGITGLIIPMLVMIIAPIALMIAMAHVLTKLSNDSELIVMNAAGIHPWRTVRPFLMLAVIVSLCVAWIAFYLSPKWLQELRRWVRDVRAEIVTSNVQPGRFIVVDGKLTLHVRSRDSSGQLQGIMVDDQRDTKQRATILAEHGNFITNDRGTFLLLENGAVQQHESGKADPVIVRFKDYAFDLLRLSSETGPVTFAIHELSIDDLISPRQDDPQYKRSPGQFRAELHNRITAPLYPLAFMMITFAYLGIPRTTRQSRTMSLLSAIAMVLAVRGLGFVGSIAGARSAAALVVPYLAIAAACMLGGLAISRGTIIEPPAWINRLVEAMVEFFKQRTAAAMGQRP
jgi:lipopolysaccharide export system permease protein